MANGSHRDERAQEHKSTRAQEHKSTRAESREERSGTLGSARPAREVRGGGVRLLEAARPAMSAVAPSAAAKHAQIQENSIE